MVGQKCCKNKKQKSIIELLQQYHEQLLSLQAAILSDQIEVAEEKMDKIESLLPELEASVSNNKNENLSAAADIQSLLLKIQELQQQVNDCFSYRIKKLNAKKPKDIKKYYDNI